MDCSQDYAARVAAEVAARYGVAVSPDAVQIVPRGVSSFAGYQFDGEIGQLRPIERHQGPGGAIKAKIGASVREAARKRRLAKAAQDKPALALAPVARAGNAHIERMQAAAAVREREVRALAEQGGSILDIARMLGVTENSAVKYCQRKRIKPAPRIGKHVQEAERKRERARQLAADGMTAPEIADAMGIDHKHIARFLKDAEIVFRSAAQEKRAAVAERRVKVEEMFKAGLSVERIVAETGATRGQIDVDCRRLGLSRKDYPLLQRAKPVAIKESRAEVLLRAAERAAEAVRLRAEGVAVKAIAERLGCSQATVCTYLEKAGVTRQYPGRAADPALLVQAKEMRARKMSIREIAEHLSIGVGRVERMLRLGRAA